MKQTAVEWLEEQIRITLKFTPDTFKKAKEMEKNQLIDAVHCNWLVDDNEQVSGLEYLKEEFGKE
jgi:hypothetical protein